MATCTIAIATHKGGTGKTVTAMAVSAAFARAGQTCLLVDLDPQGHSTLGLGVELAEGEPTLHACFSEPPLPLSRVIRATHLPGLDLAPANLRLARVAQALYMRPKREEVLRRTVAPLAGQYTYLVLDCPPSLGLLTLNALVAADAVLIPLHCEYFALEGLADPRPVPREELAVQEVDASGPDRRDVPKGLEVRQMDPAKAVGLVRE